MNDVIVVNSDGSVSDFAEFAKEISLSYDTTGCPLKKGDRVALNDNGYAVLPKLSREEMKSALGVLTVAAIGAKIDDVSWIVDIEGCLGHFMFTTRCFDKVE